MSYSIVDPPPKDSSRPCEKSPTGSRIELVIYELTPTANYLHGQHWSKKLKERKRWGWLVREARLRTGIYPSALSNRTRVTIERYGPRMMDYSNFVGGLKWLEDALVSEGFLVDDSPKHLEPVYSQHIGKPHRTVIVLEPA